MKNNNIIESLKIAATFMGTMIGAGFATGQEIISFFTIFGLDGYIGILISTIIIILIGTIILNMSFNLNTNSYHEFLYNNFGSKIGLVIDILITVFLFGIFNVMLSAAGALFNENFGLPYYFGIILTLIPVVIVAIRGIKSLLNINFIAVPLIIIIIIGIGFFSTFNYMNSSFVRNLYSNSSYKWLLSSLIYASYNIVLAIPILIPLANNAKTKEETNRGMLIAGVFIGILIIILNTVLLNNLDKNITFQIPLLHVIEPFGNIANYSFVVVLWLGIYTTILSTIFGLAYRIANVFNTSQNKIIIWISALSVFISSFDFKTLLTILYPIFGYVSLGLIIILLLGQIYQKLKIKIIYICKKEYYNHN